MLPNKFLQGKGLFTYKDTACYDGHRHESSVKERETATAPVDRQVEEIKTRLQADGLCCGILIMGGTPSFPVHAEMTDEYLSPGTCVIQDAGYRNAYPDQNTYERAKELALQALTSGCEVIVGVGGGRIMDQAKATAHFAGDLPIVEVPTPLLLPVRPLPR